MDGQRSLLVYLVPRIGRFRGKKRNAAPLMRRTHPSRTPPSPPWTVSVGYTFQVSSSRTSSDSPGRRTRDVSKVASNPQGSRITNSACCALRVPLRPVIILRSRYPCIFHSKFPRKSSIRLCTCEARIPEQSKPTCGAFRISSKEHSGNSNPGPESQCFSKQFQPDDPRDQKPAESQEVYPLTEDTYSVFLTDPDPSR